MALATRLSVFPLVAALFGAACGDGGARPREDAAQPQPDTAPPPRRTNQDAAVADVVPPPADAAVDTRDAQPQPDTSPDLAPDMPPPSPLPPQPPVVPVIVLAASAPIVDEPKVNGTFQLIEEHDGTFATLGDLAARPRRVDTKMAIELRGRSTLGYPKKSFAVELRDRETGLQPLPLPLLEMPLEADWVLYACYLDRTCLRNALAFTLAREMRNGWHPRFQFVEVFLNGTYNGLYNLVERPKRDRARVDVPRPGPTPNLDLTGGYIWAFGDGGQMGTRDFRPPTTERPYAYVFPRFDQITPDQKTYVFDYLARFEAMMRGPDFADETRGYPKWLDVSSWVDHALVRELARDIDAYRLSAYFFKTSDLVGGQLHAGPVWDFDRTFGNANYYAAGSTDGWSWKDGHVRPAGVAENPSFYWRKLLEHPPFVARMACRWRQLRAGPFATAAIHAHIDRWVPHLAAAVVRDDARWRTINRATDGCCPPLGPTHAEEVAFLKRWVTMRATWLDRTLGPSCP